MPNVKENIYSESRLQIKYGTEDTIKINQTKPSQM